MIHFPIDGLGITLARPPAEWHAGLPLGNGDLGVMCWGGGPLAFTLDKADLWDLRGNLDFLDQPEFTYATLQRLVGEGRFAEVDEIFEKRQERDNPVGPTKISLGRAELHFGELTGYDCGLSLAHASVEGYLSTEESAHRLLAFVHRTRNVFCLRVTDLPPSARLTFVPLADMNDALAALGHPAPIREEREGVQILVQAIPGGVASAVAWNAEGPEFFLAVETVPTIDEAVEKALSSWRQADALGFDRLHEEHLGAWLDFWSTTAVDLPDDWATFLWHYGIYLLASSTHRGLPPPGLQGLWAMDGVMPPWRGDYHADMNVQETFWPAAASGHLELLDAWCDLMRQSIAPARAFTRRFFGTGQQSCTQQTKSTRIGANRADNHTEGTFWPCCTLPGFTIVPCWHTVQFAWSHSGWLGWLVWLRWRYSMDTAWLAETGYPVLAGIFTFYRENLRPEADGCLHIPLSSSPEYRENSPAAWCKDPNIDIALIRRCCDWITEMEAALAIDDLTPAACEVKARLVPYALTAEGALCLWPEHPLDESHRHPSHLMAIHPAMDLTIEDGDDARRIIDASLEQYFALGRYRWAGHSYAQLASLGAVTGRAGFAYDCLHHFKTYWIGENGLHFNRDLREAGITCYRGNDRPFTMEASCAITAGISDMLLQGWGDIIRVFPAVPDQWHNAAFRDLLTEGAFRVSAERCDGQTSFVEITATVARTLRLRNPFGDAPVAVEGGSATREGDLWVADMAPGQRLVFRVDELLTDEQREALDQRMRVYLQNPQDPSSWEDVQGRIRN
ncbi:MAG: glycosyl hydrolase family 95 catalytic domain-containing protein [Armatimonadota bacterium]